MSPLLCICTNASFTACDSFSSIVNASRDQSKDPPSRRSWLQMVLPDASFHCACNSPPSRACGLVPVVISEWPCAAQMVQY